jgi:type IV secretory pathway TrbL component
VSASRSRLIVAIFAGPLAAAANLGVGDYLASRVHETGSKLGFHVASIVALVVTLAAGAYALRVARRADQAARVDRFLAVMGVALGGFFALLIVAYAIPTFILHPTD